MFHLLGNLVDRDQIRKPRRGGAIEQRKADVGFRKMFPDKLQHQQLVKVSIEQGAGNRVQLPVVVVRPLSEVNNHRAVVAGSRLIFEGLQFR